MNFEDFKEQLLNFKARYCNLYINNTEVGSYDQVLHHNLNVLKMLSNILLSFELPDENLPYVGQNNSLEPKEYREILQTCNLIMDTIINYDFKVEE